MGTTAEKLNKILETKEAIRTAINNKGGTLTETDTFASYSATIANLKTTGESATTLKALFTATKSCYYLFNGYRGTSINGLISYDDTSDVLTMDHMFNNCSKITTIPLINTSKVTNMNSMFYGCSSLTSIPQLDTSKVTYMQSMFARCEKLTTVPQLDTIKVTNMLQMFYDCYLLPTIDITYMNITSNSNSNNFAYDCYSLTKLIIRNMTYIPTLSSNAFTNCYHFTGTTNATYNPQGLKDGRIYVPDDKVDALKTATNWSTYADIIVPLSTLVE